MQPVYERLLTGLTPDTAWSALRHEPSLAFLDSRPGFGRLGRWSILAISPWLSFRVWPDRTEINGQTVSGDPLACLDHLLAENRAEPISGLPLNGGCIGTIAYDAGFALNRLPLPDRAEAKSHAGYPLMSFDFYDEFVLFDRQENAVWLLACGQLRPARDSVDDLRARLTSHFDDPQVSAASGRLLSMPESMSIQSKVSALREEIRQGEVYIANLTGEFKAETDLAGDALYDRLRQVNPAPFAAFIRQDGLEVLSSSPERLLLINREGCVETRPIKGTRPRGGTPQEDAGLAQELLDSGKDRSELLMITDLERNDLSRVCLADSVRVPELFSLESYPAVHHLTSTVIGQLKPGVTAVSCLRACFPGGSISGAPKVAAMKIIDRLEDQARSLYTGCLGYFSLDGAADLSILIRTAVKKGRDVTYGAGGGITWESDPAAEYQELLLKAAAFRKIIESR